MFSNYIVQSRASAAGENKLDKFTISSSLDGYLRVK